MPAGITRVGRSSAAPSASPPGASGTRLAGVASLARAAGNWGFEEVRGAGGFCGEFPKAQTLETIAELHQTDLVQRGGLK